MINELLLQTTQPIPFPGAKLSIHNPTIEEIGLISEDSFQAGVRFLNFSKEMLSSQDKSDLSGKTDFDIFMSIMLSKERMPFKNDVLKMLTLLFPEYMVSFTKEGIRLSSLTTKDYSIIDNSNYDEFKGLLVSMFDLDDVDDNKSNYNPADGRAAKIAEKLNKGKKKAAELKGQAPSEKDQVKIFSRYVSILSVGLQKDKNQLVKYTVWQLKDEFKRWQLNVAYEMNIRARLAGATDIEEAENWMDDIHKASK